MIKVSKHIYIHPLTVFMFAVAYLTRNLGAMAGLYLVMTLHELSHMLSAIYLRLGVSRMIFYPFGVCLGVKSRLLCSLSDKIILYLSGPLINAVIAIVMAISGRYNDFYYNNLALFILNLLPVLPLDGGRLLEEILLSKTNEKLARRIMLIISALVTLLIVGIILLYVNITLNSLSFALFILGSILLQKPKYNRDYLRMLTLSDVTCKKADVILANKDIEPQKLVKEFSPSKRTLVAFYNEEGRIEEFKTDRELIYSLIS